MLATIGIGLVALAGVSLLLQGLAVWAAAKHLGLPRPAAPSAYPAVSLLKPLKGLEDGLAENLRSCFRQDYPAPFEVVVAVESLDDLGLVIARRVAEAFPSVPFRVVVSDANFGLNPKVANLKAAYDAAAHDLVLQSDANVRLSRDYLRRVVGEFVAADAALLSSVVIGEGERSAGAAMENLQLTAFIAPGMCTALHVGGVTCVVGKSMLFRRSDLERMGGLERVADVLCEDFILGRTYREQGLRVVLSPTPVANVNEDIPVERFLSRHSRWLKMRAVIHPVSFVADLLANPVALVFFGWLASGLRSDVGLVLLATATVKTVLDAHYVQLFRGRGMTPARMALDPVKDLLMGLVWIHAAFSRSVRWRGRVLRFGRDSVLFPSTPSLWRRLTRRTT